RDLIVTGVQTCALPICGTTMIGNPQTTFLVPTFPLVLIFGATFGERLSDIALLVVACEGGWRLGRHLGFRAAPALLGALAFPFRSEERRVGKECRSRGS